VPLCPCLQQCHSPTATGHHFKSHGYGPAFIFI